MDCIKQAHQRCKPEETCHLIPRRQESSVEFMALKQLALWRSGGILDTGHGAIVIRNCEALRALIGCT
jgi:hypothetical protein